MARSPRRGRVSARAVFLALLFAAIVVLFAVLVPVHTAVYGTPLALSFLLGAALGVAPLLALTQPGWAIALFGVAAAGDGRCDGAVRSHDVDAAVRSRPSPRRSSSGCARSRCCSSWARAC